MEKTQVILNTSKKLEARLRDQEAFPYFEILGKPLGPIISFISTNEKIQIHALGNEVKFFVVLKFFL